MNIGTLEIQLLANVAKLQQDMDKTKSIVGDTMKQVEAAVNVAKSAFIAMTGVAGLDALKGIVLGSLESIAKLHELSVQCGVTVESLSGLAAVGRATGTGADTIAAASNKLSKALASANEDSKGAATALKALGLSFDDFQKMTPDERIQKVAVAMKQFEDGGQKSAAAMMLFGKTGAEMLPFLKDLAVAGELHAKVTTEQAEAAHEFEKSMGQLKANGDAWKKSLALELLPTLNELMAVLLTIKKSTSEQGSVIGEGLKVALQTIGVLGVNVVFVFKELTATVAMLFDKSVALAHLDFSKSRTIGEKYTADAKAAREEVDKLSSSLLGLTNSKAGGGRGGNSASYGVANGDEGLKTLTGLNGSAAGTAAVTPSDFDKINKQTMEQINLAAQALGASRDLTESEKARIKALSEIDAGKLTAPEKALFKQRVESIAAMQDEIKARDHVAKAVEVENAEKEKAWKAAEDYSASLDRTLSDLAFETSLLGKDADAIKQMTALRKLDAEAQRAIAAAKGDPVAQALVTSQSGEAAQKVVAGMAQQKAAQDALNASWSVGAKTALTEYSKQVSNVAGATQNAIANAFKGMEDALVSFVKTGKLDFSSLADSIIGDLARIAVQQSITGPLAKMLGLSTGGGGAGGILNSIILPSIGGARALGGPVAQNTPYLVGEKGPELFVPGSSGAIIPNGQTTGGGSQQTIHVTQNFTVGDVASISMVRQAVAGSERRIAGALGRSQGYGGSMA
jgi:lambda family phage tail tape measure protein